MPVTTDSVVKEPLDFEKKVMSHSISESANQRISEHLHPRENGAGNPEVVSYIYWTSACAEVTRLCSSMFLLFFYLDQFLIPLLTMELC